MMRLYTEKNICNLCAICSSAFHASYSIYHTYSLYWYFSSKSALGFKFQVQSHSLFRKPVVWNVSVNSWLCKYWVPH